MQPGEQIRWSLPAMIVLRDLRGADGMQVVKATLSELVGAGAWRLTKVRRRLRSVDGLVRDEAAVPDRSPLPLFSARIESSPAMSSKGATVRALPAVARHLAAWHGHTPTWVVNLLLDELTAAGLVDQQQLETTVGEGTVRTSVARRTDAGDRLLGTWLEGTPAAEEPSARAGRTRRARRGLLAFAGSGISQGETYDIFRLGLKEADNRADAFGESFTDAFDAGASHSDWGGGAAIFDSGIMHGGGHHN